jgi:hypothetical protein
MPLYKCLHGLLNVPVQTANKMGVQKKHSLLLSFWTLSIVWISTNQKTQRFRNWICFRPQAGGGGGTYCTKKKKKLAFPQAMPEQKKVNHSKQGDDGQSPEA